MEKVGTKLLIFRIFISALSSFGSSFFFVSWNFHIHYLIQLFFSSTFAIYFKLSSCVKNSYLLSLFHSPSYIYIFCIKFNLHKFYHTENDILFIVKQSKCCLTFFIFSHHAYTRVFHLSSFSDVRGISGISHFTAGNMCVNFEISSQHRERSGEDQVTSGWIKMSVTSFLWVDHENQFVIWI